MQPRPSCESRAKAEIESAICRLLREGKIFLEMASIARLRLETIANAWIEIDPTPDVRTKTIRMLRVHPLRPGDAFQLAAALTACDDHPSGFHFLTADARLKQVAMLEGFIA